MGGGAGAFADRDGMDAMHVHTVNSTNLPVEALELEYPLLLDEYALRAGFRRRGSASRRHGHGAADPHPS
jgi:N-methylhydantoinase B/oxoprolinase/acetone carboxylase alpha subunit